MKVISRKSEIQPIIEECLVSYKREGINTCAEHLHKFLLVERVKFPLLEYCGYELYLNTALEEQLNLCDLIEQLKTEGGNVLLGTILQRRLGDHFEESIQKAVEYISNANAWHTCDIIGERVFGVSLLRQPAQTIPILERLFQHESNWVVRSLGSGIHYAIKKGLPKEHVQPLFVMLLGSAKESDKEIRQGVGWAAKTAAKYHPEVIEQYRLEINNPEKVDNWFRIKIES